MVQRLSKPAAAAAAEAAAATATTTTATAGSPVSLTHSKSEKMKGLFKSKPRTPTDIVRQTRDLLIYADRPSSDPRDAKREEKVSVMNLI